jgi:hypothetical protein
MVQHSLRVSFVMRNALTLTDSLSRHVCGCLNSAPALDVKDMRLLEQSGCLNTTQQQHSLGEPVHTSSGRFAHDCHALRCGGECNEERHPIPLCR